MEDKRSAVVALYQNGRKPSEILNELKNTGVNRMFIYRTIKRFTETGSTKKRYGGGRKTIVRVPANVGKIRKRLRRNPRQSLRNVAKMTGISATSVRRIAKRNLGLKPYKIQEAHELAVTQKKNHLLRSKQLF